MKKQITVALTANDTTLLLESVAYRMMALNSIRHRAAAAPTAASKKEALAAVMATLQSAVAQSGSVPIAQL
jgi:hypothetical protein